MTAVTFRAVPVVIVMSAILLLPRFAAAHCDSMDGPVVNAAKLALKTSDVTPLLRWVPLAAESPSIDAVWHRQLILDNR